MSLEDEVFAKVFGYNGGDIEKFNRELFEKANVQIAQNAIRQPKPNTNKIEHIKQILENLAPFVMESMEKDRLIESVKNHSLYDYVKQGSVMYFQAYKDKPPFVAICTSAIFRDDLKAYEYRLIKKGFKACNSWLITDYGIFISDYMEPLLGGFPDLGRIHLRSPAARFYKVSDANNAERSIR